MEGLKVDVSTEDEILVLTLKGQLLSRDDGQTVLSTLYQRWPENKVVKILVDLSEINYMNSEGLGTLLRIFTKARQSGGDMALWGINDRLKQLFIITRLHHIFNVFDQRAQAMEFLSGQTPSS
ncbi:MAG: STAS domain-containing protein [Flavobacteriales bacterium]|nr:STAS domain-containing protein [Flavobacteriales bacterium]MCX7768231.1 STAS domain-containing protein [Flavobacteriales bacterium]MDW8410132.1 STAS domain-containing protein [Flavobacteriales bacterium]